MNTIKCLNPRMLRIFDEGISKHYVVKNIYLKEGKRNAGTQKNDEFSLQYCSSSVKKHDYENFLCTLLMKGYHRRGAFAIRAFNVEVSRIASMVTDDQIGRMRLQFWHDAIDNLYKKESTLVHDHPVINEVKYHIEHNNISKRFFQRLIDARRNYSQTHSFITNKELESYCEHSVSSVYYLLFEIFGIKNVNADHAASHLGKAQGISNLLRSIPHLNRNHSIPIPQEILINHGISQERIIRNKENDKGVQECVFDVATLAHQHLKKSRDLSKTLPPEAKLILLPAVAVGRYLEKLRKVDFHLTHKHFQLKDSLLPLAYYISKLKGNY